MKHSSSENIRNNRMGEEKVVALGTQLSSKRVNHLSDRSLRSKPFLNLVQDLKNLPREIYIGGPIQN